jgi:hypothetical protein
MSNQKVLSTFAANKTQGGLIFNKFGGSTIVRHPRRPNTDTAVIAADLSIIDPANAVLFRLNPNTPLNGLGSSSQVAVEWSFSAGLNIHRIDSVKIEMLVRNAGLTPVFIAPTPFWFNSVQMSATSAGDQPFWTTNASSHITQLVWNYEEQHALKIAREENFRSTNGFGEAAIELAAATPGPGIVSSYYSFLQAGDSLAPGETRRVAFYLLDSLLQAPGFTPQVLIANTLSMDIRATFNAGDVWSSANNSVTIDNVQLVFEGARADEGQLMKIGTFLRAPETKLIIPNKRYITAVENFASIAADTPVTVNLRTFVGTFSSLKFYLGPSGAKTSTTGVDSLLQLYTAKSGDSSTNVIVQGSKGEAFQIKNFNLLQQGVQITDTVNMSSQDLQTRAMSTSEEKAFLGQYYPAIYNYSFSTDTMRDEHTAPSIRHGYRVLQGDYSLQFEVSAPLTNVNLYIVGNMYQELVYEAQSSAGRPDLYLV